MTSVFNHFVTSLEFNKNQSLLSITLTVSKSVSATVFLIERYLSVLYCRFRYFLQYCSRLREFLNATPLIDILVNESANSSRWQAHISLSLANSDNCLIYGCHYVDIAEGLLNQFLKEASLVAEHLRSQKVKASNHTILLTA